MSWIADALNANVVRRLVGPLRTSTPRLYARLNTIRKHLLVRGAEADAYQVNAVRSFASKVPLRGARVLELGSDLQLRVLRMLVAEGVAQARGVNYAPELWAGHGSDRIERDGAVLHNADAASLPFPDGSFDHVFSVATFEHVPDLARVLDEAHRVLVPGGILYANFGPIWSGGKGHHVHADGDGEMARHFIPEANPLPDWSHLLLAPDELRAGLTTTNATLRDAIVAGVYASPDVNRLFYHQYVAAFRASRFELVSLKPERDPLSPQLRRVLELRYPHERDFDITNVEVVLRRA